jgi:peptidoglycan/LPS O-acetylase OafA/YrhL
MLRSSNQNEETSTRFDQLDGLRAIAVFGVFMTHWLPVGSIFGFSPGRLGVNLFFVLSGFLITGILLEVKTSIGNGTQSLARAAGHFYARRALRLLPLLYVVLLIGTALDYPGVRETVVYHIFYLGNFYFAYLGEWSKTTTHLWSLAVEEQFYLVWPWVILLTPKRFLLSTILGVIVSAPLFRLLCYGLEFPSVSIRTLTPSSFDMFGVGALLVLIAKDRGYKYVADTKLVDSMLVLGLPLLAMSTVLHDRETLLYEVGQSLGSALLFGWVVIRATVGFSGITGTILSSRPMVYAGTISYGLYVIHNFVPYMVGQLIGDEMVFTIPLLARFSVYVVVTFLLASLSWHFFERPVNSLKKNFEYFGTGPKSTPKHLHSNSG